MSKQLISGPRTKPESSRRAREGDEQAGGRVVCRGRDDRLQEDVRRNEGALEGHRHGAEAVRG